MRADDMMGEDKYPLPCKFDASEISALRNSQRCLL